MKEISIFNIMVYVSAAMIWLLTPAAIIFAIYDLLR